MQKWQLTSIFCLILLLGCQANQQAPVVMRMPVQVLDLPVELCWQYPSGGRPVNDPLLLNAEAANGVKASSDGKENVILWRAEPVYPITIKATAPQAASYTIISTKTLVLTTTQSVSPTFQIATRGTPCSVLFGEQEERQQEILGLRLLLVLLVGGLPILFGIFNLFASNLAWEFHYFGMRTQGITPERTPEWEANRLLLGIGLILAGIVLGILTMQIGA
ncbi:hypothetical protein BH10CHL1_BH10CHL1_15070 [soil metagenome]